MPFRLHKFVIIVLIAVVFCFWTTSTRAQTITPTPTAGNGFYFDQTEDMVNNGESYEKLDILFIPFNISEEFYSELRYQIIYSDGQVVQNMCGDTQARGLFRVEPFSSNQQKFNIKYSVKALDFDYFNCSFYGSDPFSTKPIMTCDWDKLRENIPFETDIITILSKDFRTLADKNIIMFGDLASADPNTPVNYGFVHEFGHAFGGLTDEYTYILSWSCNDSGCYYTYPPDRCVDSEDPNCFIETEKEISYIPNEDVVGCPKWCEDYDKDKLNELSQECAAFDNMQECITRPRHCIWFKQKHPWFNANCVPRSLVVDIGINCKSQCILDQHYQHLGFSPDCSEGGMMSNRVGDFNPISENHLSLALECCYPPGGSIECRDFSDKFKLVPDVNPYFKFAYDKFANCFDNSSTTTPTPTVIGDADGDGDVDIEDYIIWVNNYNQSTSNGANVGDFNQSGIVDGVDYIIWLNNFPSS